MTKPKPPPSQFLSPFTPVEQGGAHRAGVDTSGKQQKLDASMEDTPWDAAVACVDLQRASQILTERGLKLSAKWAVEQWLGLPPEIIESAHVLASPTATQATGVSFATGVASTIPDDLLWGSDEHRNPSLNYARTLLDLGEYAHSAAVLSETSLTNKAASVEHMPPPLPGLSPKAIFTRAYALYMAGERRKEEDLLESQSEGNKHAYCRNPYLQQLAYELLDAYEAQLLDAFGLHVYGMVLSAGRTSLVLPPHSPSAQTVLIQSILQFPYNWSAWLDLSLLVVAQSEQRDTVEADIEEQLQPVLASHFMYHFFCAHLQAERQSHAESLVIYERWMDASLFGGSPYLLGQHAVCSYHTRDFASAKSLMQDLHNHMPYRLDSMEVFSNILYVQEDSVALSALAHVATQVDKYRAETCCIVGNYYSLKQQRAKAIQYFQRALKMDRTFTSAWTLMGHEYVEWKQTANAMEAYRRAVQVSPTDFRAWYGLGQTYELLNMNLYALYYYKQAAQLRPYDARMWCAVGTTYTQLQRTSDAIRSFERAVQHDDADGVATQKLAALYRQEERHEDAAKCYMRHLELRHRPTHAITPAKGSDSLETMLLGVTVEATEAEAILYLANYYRENADYDTSAILCSRLLDYPGPEREQAKAMLRELKSRKSRGTRSVIHTRSKGPVEETFDFSP